MRSALVEAARSHAGTPVRKSVPARPKLVAGQLLLNRHNRRLLEKATRAIEGKTSVPGRVRNGLGRPIVQRLEEFHGVDIAFDGRVTRKTTSAAASPI
jgi:hypothetical protein